MQLSRKDRVVLVNQYEILKRLDTENSSSYDQLIKILIDGYEIFYSDLDEWYTEMAEDDSRFVLDLLTLYRHIENYKRINPEDEEISSHHFGHFQGFDGNEEGKYFIFVKFLIQEQGKFAEQLPYQNETDGYNSHWPILQHYRDMVMKWQEFGGGVVDSHEKILAILSA